MLRIDKLIFGYRRITIDSEKIKNAANIFIANNINVRFIGNCFTVSERDFKRIRSLLDGNIEYKSSETLGLYGIVKKIKKRYGVILGIIISMAFGFLSSSLVWDVRIEGCENGKEEAIVNELSSLGFSVGKLWGNIDTSSVEADMLSISENVSWININRRGSVAYVSVIDKIEHTEPEKKKGYANIVASRDCIIEEISVKRGVAMVKPGETVKKGQILISGVIPLEKGGGFCYAEGCVIGRYSDSISVKVSKTETKKLEGDKKLKSFSVNFFTFSVNLYKRYRNLPYECVIIEDKRSISFFGLRDLPFSLVREYVLEYEDIAVNYSSEDMVTIASLRMKEALNTKLKQKNLLRIKTHGEFSQDAYIMKSEYVCSDDIGESVEFEFIQ